MKRFLFLIAFLITLTSSNVFAQDKFDISIDVSKAQYFEAENFTANSNGVYPVKISINSRFKASVLYKIYCAPSKYSHYDYIGAVKDDYQSDNIEFIHINLKAKPGQKYYYKVQAVLTSNNKIYGESDSVEGWGALEYETLFVEFSRKVKISWDRLTLMNKKSNLDKLGQETINGMKNGTLSYKTKLSGLSGVVTMDYKNYSDDENWVFNNTILTKANMFGNGTMSGQIDVTGMYPCTVYYDKVIIKNSGTGGGTYGIKPAGNERKEMDYKLSFVE